MTIYEENRKRWGERAARCGAEWAAWKRYSPSIAFVRDVVPEMLAQMDADTESIERLRISNSRMRAALGDAGIDVFEVLRDKQSP